MSKWDPEVFGEWLRRTFRRYTLMELASKGLERVLFHIVRQRCCVYKRAYAVDSLDGIVSLWNMNKNDEVPTRFIEQLRQAEGDRHTELLLGSQERGTNVYLIVHQENVVGFCKSRSGIFVERWYRPLEPQDVIIFGATVFPEYRGLGYAPAAYDALCRLHDGVGVVYIDAVRNNKAAIRAIEKAGFLIEGVYRIGEWKPI